MDHPLPEKITGFSKALYSTWFLYQSLHLLFDAGEGVATWLEQKLATIDYIFLSHGHLDHISGLPTLISIRDRTLGPTERPLHIHYPRGDALLQPMREYIEKSQTSLGSPVHWVPMEPGDEVEVTTGGVHRHGRKVRAFATCHQTKGLTLGYYLLEIRQRLKEEHRHLTSKEVQKLAFKGKRDGLMELYDFRLLTYVGDTVPLDPAIYEGTEVLLHEATHFGQGVGHTTVVQAIELACRVNPGHLVLYHLSPRYEREEALGRLRKECERQKVDFPVWVQWERDLVPLIGEEKL